MLKVNRKFGSVMFGLAFLAACQAPQKPQDEAISNQEGASTSAQVDASEGVVGPDEAFFAEYYLEQVFQYSQENANPQTESGAGWNIAPQSVSAFDFKANFTEQRLGLMVKSLYLLGDTDGDGALSEREFAALRLDPTLFGVNQEARTHGFGSSFFLRLAGGDELLQTDECLGFLRDIGPAVKEMLDRSTAQEQRRGLVKSWEKVLGRYDADQSGNLSLQEQRELRKDRASLVTRLGAE